MDIPARCRDDFCLFLSIFLLGSSLFGSPLFLLPLGVVHTKAGHFVLKAHHRVSQQHTLAGAGHNGHIPQQTMVKIADLKPYPKNTKKHTQTQIDNVAESIRQFGFVQPFVIDKNNEVVIGHCRLLAAQKLGIEELPCVYVDYLTKAQIKALRILDNKLNESEWDMDFLNEELPEIDLTAFEIEGWEEPDTKVEDEEIEERKQINDIDVENSLIIECQSETEIENLFDEMTSRGYKCRVSTL